jgi:lycopene beta-cyclase
MAGTAFDLILVGGGLQNGLIALSTLHSAPQTRIAMVEAGDRLGGNHTWCVHARDLPVSARAWFEPLVVKRWSGYDVRFPGFARTLGSTYAVVSSERFAEVLSERFAQHPSCRVLLQTKAIDLTAQTVRLDNGELWHARRVVDARGPDVNAYSGQCGYQKFVGLELITEQAHGLTRPILMDATCDQVDGFRFFYVLPLATDRLLVEETRFSLQPSLDMEAGRQAVRAYAARFGVISSCIREEHGVLPMPWSLDSVSNSSDAPADQAEPLRAGYGGGYFHPATGYSLPAAIRIAEVFGQSAAGVSFSALWRVFARNHRIQAIYALQLNRLLFTGFAETDMWEVLARFYHLPEDLIERFYALSSSVSDCARIVIGRPPRGFSVLRALTRAMPQRLQRAGASGSGSKGEAV